MMIDCSINGVFWRYQSRHMHRLQLQQPQLLSHGKDRHDVDYRFLQQSTVSNSSNMKM